LASKILTNIEKEITTTTEIFK